MGTKSVRSRSLLAAACVLAMMFGRPSVAHARIDWIGWLEGFSGPGPSDGFELSFEFACLDVVQRLVVNRSDIERVLPKLQTVDQALTELRSAAPGARDQIEYLRTQLLKTSGVGFPFQDPRATSTGRAGSGLPLPSQGIETALAAVRKAIPEGASRPLQLFADLDQAIRNAPILESRALTAAMLGFGQSADDGTPIDVPATTKRSLAVFGAGKGGSTVRSCHRARTDDIERLRQADRRGNALLLRRLTPRNIEKPSPENLIVSRHDWQTGIVLGVGRYKSLENVLFDPTRVLSGANEEPQLRLVPIELLAHSKLSPAVDIGTGVGVAWFHTQARDGTRVGSDRFAFYYVPLTAVVRPGAMFFPDNKLLSAIGYRIAVRRFGELDGSYFGTDAAAFTGKGEFIWGHSIYVDLVTLLGK